MPVGCRTRRDAGFTLIEAIFFIVVLAVLLAGLVVAFGSSLRWSPQAGQIDLAAELAQQRMELILGQRRAAGFGAFGDPCVPGPGPAACTAPAGYTITSSISAGFGGPGYKTVTVAVAGPTPATATALVANY